MLLVALILFFKALFYVPELPAPRPEIGNNESVVSTIEVYKDVEGTLQVDDMVSNQGFKILDEDEVEIGTDDIWWVKFKTTTDPEKRDIVFDFKDWSYVDFYYRESPSEDFKHLKTGHLLPFDSRSLPVLNEVYIPLQLSATGQYECYVRLDGEFNGLRKATRITPFIYESSQFEGKVKTNIIVSAILLGVFVVMLLYNGFLFYTTKDITYRFYLVMIFLLTTNIMDSSGLAFELFGGISFLPQVIRPLNYIGPQILVLVLLLFFNDFFHVKERYPGWYKYLKGVFAYTIVTIILMMINFDIGLLFGVGNGLIVPILVFTVAIKSIRSGFPSSLLWLIAHLFWYTGGIINMFSKIGVLPPSDFGLLHSFAAGSGIEMILFSIALGNKINVLEKENEEKQNLIIEQLEHNQKLQSKVNRELEEKVSQRTEQILEQNKEIQEQAKKLEVEKERSDRLLLNILPKEVAEELKLNGHATPKYYEVVSILFIDIQGFSTMAEDISPNDLVKDLDYCFSGFDYIISRYNLEKIKTIGDAYMCVSGLPKSSETHAHDTVKAGLEILEFISRWKDENPVLGENGLNVRLGIHSGPVIAGVVGKKKFQFDIWGNSVNLASRMESNSEPGRINISHSTYELVKDEFEFEERGILPVKNMGDIKMYFVKEPMSVR